jgi:ParB/RepB/Spo0J family partition protein
VSERPRYEYREIPLDVVKRPGRDLRTHADEDALEELRQDINARGVLVPILVVEEGDGYRLVAGLRRLLCAAANGLATIPAIVAAGDESWQAWATIAENRLRENVNPVDEAAYIAALLEHRKCSGAEAAALLGVSESWVSQRLCILRWPEDVRNAVRDGWLSFAAGREISQIEDPVARRYCLRTAQTCGCSVRQAATWRHNWQSDGMVRGRDVRHDDAEVPGGDSALSYECVVCNRVHDAAQGMVAFLCQPCLDIIEHAKRQEDDVG